MNKIPNSFLHNLYETCKTNHTIKEDGKTLTLIDKIIHFFIGKSNNHHFKSICEQLSTHSISVITSDQQIEILGRIRYIQNKIKNTSLKKECDQYIKNFESKIKKEDIDRFRESIFNDIKTAYIDADHEKLNNRIRKLESIIEYYSQDYDSIEKIALSWRAFIYDINTLSTEKTTDKFWLFFNSKNNTITEKILNKESSFLKNNSAVDTSLIKYPLMLRFHLLQTFSLSDKMEVYARLCELNELMNQYSAHPQFINKCLMEIDEVLKQVLFNDAWLLFEERKSQLLVFKELFSIMEKHLPSVQDNLLKLSLKIKCANLPCPTNRSSFPNLFLTAKDQLEVLTFRLEKKENEAIKSLIDFLTKNSFPKSEIPRLVKLVSEKSPLSQKNRSELRQALESSLNPQTIQNWEDPEEVSHCLKTYFSGLNNQTTPIQTSPINLLKRISKTKAFFQNQLTLDEEMICIPSWYHATSSQRICSILSSGNILVQHQQLYKGAWVSTERESDFGHYVISLNQRLPSLDSAVAIHNTPPGRRWRGIQKPIPLYSSNSNKSKNASHLTMIGVPAQANKAAQKTDKLKLIKILKEKGFPDIKTFSITQIDFIQKQVRSILGTPNLPDQWWGKERAYSEHQARLQSEINTMPLNPDLFTIKTPSLNQLAIGTILQSIVLPLYKKPMPQQASYQKNPTDTRQELGQHLDDDAYAQHVNKIDQQKMPARKEHGTMHALRTALWTQLLSKVYEKLGKGKVNHSILLATTGGFHDVARENERRDYWDEESAKALEILLNRIPGDEEEKKKYTQAISEKDPKNREFSSNIQEIVHDADCLEIVRVIGKRNFDKKELCFYQFDPKQKQFCDALIDEVANFIVITEDFHIRNQLEHHSKDAYGDLVRLLFQTENGKIRFPLITELLKEDMEEILKPSP